MNEARDRTRAFNRKMRFVMERFRPPRFDAVLFDCDGTLVDSEAIANDVLRGLLDEMGWRMSLEECLRVFVGSSVQDKVDVIEANTGVRITPAWLADFRKRRNAILARRLLPIPNAVSAVAKAHLRYQGRIACASGAERSKIELQLRICGLMPYFEGRIFSGQEVSRTKPAPCVYLAAAGGLGVDPRRCAVIEDTAIGVSAGVAAGAVVFAYCPPGAAQGAQALRGAGAFQVFGDMAELDSLLDA